MRWWLLVVVLLLTLTGCAGSEQKVQEAGQQAAQEAASEVGTARLAVQQLVAGKVWAQSAEQLVEDSEKGLDQIASGFTKQQPQTPEARRAYDEVSQALADARTAVTDVRIALGNDDRSTAARQVGGLEKTARRLTELAR